MATNQSSQATLTWNPLPWLGEISIIVRPVTRTVVDVASREEKRTLGCSFCLPARKGFAEDDRSDDSTVF